jgi:hypothetical protein
MQLNSLDSTIAIRYHSNDNITQWNPRLEAAWKAAKDKRNQICAKKKMPLPIQPERRFIFLSEKIGDHLSVSSFKTAKSRVDRMAVERAEAEDVIYNHFTFHDLKRKGVTDTEGTISEKQEASGHKSQSMMNIYNVKPSIVKPAKDLFPTRGTIDRCKLLIYWGERWGSNPRQPESQFALFYLLINDLISPFVIISQK